MKSPDKRCLRYFPRLSLMAFLLPVVLGLLGTWLPAFGYLPVIGADRFSFDPFIDFFTHPSTAQALQSTLISGIIAPAAAFFLALWLIGTLYGTSLWTFVQRSLAPLLAIPHASFAIGFGFLIAPSGWLLRLISPEFTGMIDPPDWQTVKDPLALCLTAALVFKEVPFLLLMGIGALNQIDVRRTRWVGGSLGYSNYQVWGRLILPQLLPKLRLPLLAVFAYSLSVVDLAIILGPTTPPTLPVLVHRWFNDPDIVMRLQAAAGASFLFILVMLVSVVVIVIERAGKMFLKNRILDGKRTSILDRFRWTGIPLATVLLITTFLSLCVLLSWSFAKRWRFPDNLPADLTLRFWEKGLQHAASPLSTTITTGCTATIISIILVVGCLEYEKELAQKGIPGSSHKNLWLLYLPLLVPQISFLFGVQWAVVFLRVEGTWLSLVYSHLIFVFPYVFLTLAQVYRGYDDRYLQVAEGLSGSYWLALFRVKLPMLLNPIAFSMAVGFSVSVVQYLPTLYIGAGRFSTITTETVSLASGADRRLLAVYALLQFSVPLFVYAMAILGPMFVFRNRVEMQN